MARNDYTLDGVKLTDPAGRWFPERKTGIRVLPARRSNNLQYPGVDGERFIPGAPFEPGMVMIRLYVEGKTHEEFMTNYEFITGLLGQRHKTLELVHQYDAAGLVTRHAQVTFPDSSEPELDGPLRAMIDLNGQVTGSFWRSKLATDSTTPAVTTVGTIRTLAELAGGNAPITDALIRVKGGFSTLAVEDPVSLSRITFNAALTATEYIIVDPVNWTARKVTTDTWAGGTEVDATVVSNKGSGTMFELAPSIVGGAFATQIKVWCSNPTGSPVVTVRAKKSYL